VHQVGFIMAEYSSYVVFLGPYKFQRKEVPPPPYSSVLCSQYPMKNAHSLACIIVYAPFRCHILDQVLQATAHGRSLVTVTQVFIRVFSSSRSNEALDIKTPYELYSLR